MDERQVRAMPLSLETRDENGAKVIEGYFAKYGDIYEIAPGMTESIAPGAFKRSLDGDIRALVNHDTSLVLGRTKSGTLVLRDEEQGLWGSIAVNPKDSAAMDLYARVQRGDVDQCSFGFSIRSQNTDIREDGSVHWTLTDVDLYEVSCCTFPAYKSTNISARAAERDDILKRKVDAWRERTKARLHNGIKDTDASKKTE